MKACILPEIADKLRESLQKGEIDANAIAKMLPEEKLALKSILESVVSENLGIKVSPNEIKEITKISKKIDTAQQNLGDNLGNPNKLKENLEFFKAKREMDDYLLSKSPSNRLKVLTGTIGRGMMLFSVKSPTLNIGSNIEIGLTEALARRISNFGIKGADNKLAVDFVKMNNKIYQATGYDLSRMTSLKDSGSDGSRVLGETTHSQGKGIIRKVGRGVEKLVFKQLMGAPDVAFSSAHFADSLNLHSLKIAEGDTAKAKEFMIDAMRIEPQTPEGLILRNQAILDAEKATWTDTSWASKISEGVRKILNEVSGDIRAGDYLLPFVKTPANVIATGMDYGGVGIPKAFFKLYKAIKQGDLGDKETVSGIARDLIRAGIGIAGALMITSKLDDDDYVGAYDPTRSQIESLRNSNTNSVRIGKKWISLDWFGPLAVPINAIMYARKYGKTPGEKTFQYTKGVLSSALEIPGVADVYDAVKANAYKKNQTLEEMTGSATNYISSEIYSRLIPSFLSDIAKAVDPNLRQTVKGVESIKSKIPFVSKTLPVKKNIFGEEIKGESPITDIFLGSRVKTDKEDPLVKEINTISINTDKGITFTDWDKSSGKKLAQFKDKVGVEKYNKAKEMYGLKLKSLLNSEINKSSYKKLSDEEKLKVITNQDTVATDYVFKQFGFKYKQK